jgi:esterase/lipase superfamily enzyme
MILSLPVKTTSRGLTLMLAALLASTLAGCASRPDATVLSATPVTSAKRQVVLLSATNRQLAPDGSFDSDRAEALTFERYTLSVPPAHKASAIEYPDTTPDPLADFVVTSRTGLSKDRLLAAAAAGDGSVGLFVPGYNYSYQEGLFRLAQIAADANLRAIPILFSWPSQAKATAYLADKDSSLASRDALASLLISLASQPGVRRIVLFGHSMGGFLVMETARQLKLEGRTDVVEKLSIVLAAPDIDADVFRTQMETIGKLSTPVTLLVSNTDRVLRLSSFIAGERKRVGSLSADDPAVRAAAKRYDVRVIDITSLKDSDGFGHARFASLPQYAAQLAALGQGARNSRPGIFVFRPTTGVLAGARGW